MPTSTPPPPNSERIFIDLIDKESEFESFKTLRKGIIFGRKIQVSDIVFSKADISELIRHNQCTGLEVKIALDSSNKINIYLQPTYSGNTGPNPGPGVGHGPTG